MNTLLLRVVLSGTALWIAAQAHAADIVWTNTADGFWHTAANWRPAQVPGAADHVWITNSGTYVVTHSSSEAIAALTIGGDNGNQTLKQHAGTLALNGEGTGNTNAVLQMEGGMWGGSGSLTLAGSILWTGGTITGVVQCAGGTLITGDLDRGRLVNTGVLTVLGAGALWMDNGAVISNLAGATLNVTTNFDILSNGGGSVFVNEGIFRKSGDDTAYIGVSVTNTGTLLVDGGTLDQRVSFRSCGGTNTVVSPGTLTFWGPSAQHNLDAGSILTGNGTVTCGAGTLQLDNTFNLTGTLLINGGTAVFNAPATISQLSVYGGLSTLGGTGLVTAESLSVSSGGTITGSVQCAGGIIAVGFLKGGRLLNSGSLVVSNHLYTGDGATFSNLVGATLDLAGDWNIAHSGTGARASVRNLGTLRKSAGNGTSQVMVPLANEGTIEVQTGALSFLLGGTNTGSISAASGAVLNFSADNTARRYWLGPGSTFGGEGTVACNLLTTVDVDSDFAFTGTNLINGGTMSFNAAPTLGALTLSNGTLGGSGFVTVSGPLLWAGGTITGAVQCAGGAISSGTSKSLNGGRLINTGVLTLGGTNLVKNASSVISNAPGATIDVVTNLNIGTSGAGGVFFNAGLFRKTGGTGTARVFGTFHNTGTIDAQRGTLDFYTIGDNRGVNSATAPGTLSLSGSHVLDAGSSLTGSGTVLGSGNVTVNGDCTVTGTNLLAGGTTIFNVPATLGSLVITGSSATLGGTGLVTVSGPLIWNAGSITGAVQCAGGLIRGTIYDNPYLNGGRLVNSGVLQFTGGTLYTGSGSVISNLPGATFDLAWKSGGGISPPNIVHFPPPTRSDFHNAGLFCSAGGAVADAFHNRGTVRCTNGTLTFGATCEQSAGMTQLLGGKLKVNQGFTLAGGVLTGTNALVGTLTNLATLVPGPAVGILTIASNYVELPGSVLEMELGGLSAGAGFDQLVVTGAVALAGTLNVSLTNGFIPPANASFPIVTAVSVSGTFAATNLPAGPFGLGVDYTATSVLLRVLNTPPAITPETDRTLPAGQTFAMQLAATDFDLPAQALTWALASGPTGLTISPSGGLVWTPDVTWAQSTNPIVVRVTDDGLPENLADSLTFNLVVTEPAPPSLAVAITATNTVVVSWPLPETGWRLQASTNLSDQPPAWMEIAPPYLTNSVRSLWVGPAHPGDRFFRLRKQ